jgi:hypothetical protein
VVTSLLRALFCFADLVCGLSFWHWVFEYFFYVFAVEVDTAVDDGSLFGSEFYIFMLELPPSVGFAKSKSSCFCCRV